MSEAKFKLHSSIWEENAKNNAKWAVISDPDRLKSGFQVQDFINSGMNDISNVLGKLQNIKSDIDFDGRALDFGCGVGRLTLALAKRFRSVVGIDVSPEMVRQARELTAESNNIEFIVNPSSDLKIIESSSLAFILSLIVLQHIPPPYSLEYLKEFARVLKPGGVLVVQIPTKRVSSFKNTIRTLIPERLFRLKHSLLRSKVPYVTMFGLSEAQVLGVLTKEGLSRLKIEPDTSAGKDWESQTYFFRK